MEHGLRYQLPLFFGCGLHAAAPRENIGRVPLAERGSYEVGSWNRTDFYIEQPFTFKGITIALYANVFHLFNQQIVTGVESNVDLGTYQDPTNWQDPRAYQLGFKFEF